MSTETSARPAGRKRGAYAKTEQKRSEILDAALEVFASGYNARSIKDVAVRVGMSEAGLLHHFPSKSALLIAVLERRDDKSYEIVPFDTIDGRSGIIRLVNLARYNMTVPGVVELFCVLSAEATSPDHPAHNYFQNRYTWTRESVTGTFTKLEAEGLLRPDIEPRKAAIATIAMMDGLQVQWLLHPDELNMADEFTSFVNALVTFDVTED